MGELWTLCYDNPNYEVSSFGRIKRKHPASGTSPGKILKQETSNKGYLRCQLWMDGKSKKYLVHRLILNSFQPSQVPVLCVNHKDGNKKNNNINNLEWVTHKQNTNHALKNGLMSCGEKRYNSKLSINDIRKIRKLINKESLRSIAKKFNVSHTTIYGIKTGRIWRMVQ